jgi:hypothetical protein
VADTGPPITLPYLTLAFARDELGVEEEPRGSNDGPRVREYLAAVHMPPGVAWCAAFASWCVKQASASLGVPPLLHGAAGALRLLSLNPTLRIDRPEPGCLVVWDHGEGHGHVGLVEEVTPLDLGTIEGNTDEHGGAEGYMVARRRRLLDDPRLAGYLRVA